MSQPAWPQAAGSTSSSASGTAPSPIEVNVTGKAPDRDQRDYHDALKGVEIFNKFHSLAPQAELHFKLYPRSEDLQRDDIKLHLKSESVRRDIALKPDWTFDIPYDATADKERGDLVTNRPEKSFAWRSYIRTPDLPANTRRLGDLRLECMVDLASHLVVIPPTPGNLALVPVFGSDLCSMSTVHYFFFADLPVFGVTLINKEKHLALQTAVWLYGNRTPKMWTAFVDFMQLDDQVYEVPMADTTWSDDTLVELDYMDAVQLDQQRASATTAPSAIN